MSFEKKIVIKNSLLILAFFLGICRINQDNFESQPIVSENITQKTGLENLNLTKKMPIMLASTENIPDIPNAPFLLFQPPAPKLIKPFGSSKLEKELEPRSKQLREAKPTVRGQKHQKNIPMPWDDMDRDSLVLAIDNQLKILDKKWRDEKVNFANTKISIEELRETLQAFKNLLERNLPKKEFNFRVKNDFDFIPVGSGPKKKMLFTGYYTPVIEASRTRAPGYDYPIYQKPENLSRNRYIYRQRYIGDPYARLFFTEGPNYTREDIDGFHLLDNRHLEIAWLRDEMDRYFLHIQGSGVLRFPDGEMQNVQYTGSNGYAYQSVGKKLLKDGVIHVSQGSMQAIKRHFRNHPEDIPKYVYENKRYIFFKPSDEGPRGASGAPVVGGRSIAVDPKYYPYGALGFMTAKKPILGKNEEITQWEKLSRFVIAQDTGSAIRGKGRIDLYFGTGKYAGAAAGRYMQSGKLFFLLKKQL